MTIAAAFCCSDGLVMCADSQGTVGNKKLPAEKLLVKQNPSTQLMIAGSGIMELVWMASERIHQELSAGYDDHREAERVIGLVLNSLYEKEIRLFPAAEKDELSITLLIGYKYRASRPVLFRTDATAIWPITDYAIIGSGRVIQNQIHHLYHPEIEVSRAVLLATQLLRVAKTEVTSVGGLGRIAALHTGDAGLHEEVRWQVAAGERTLGNVAAPAGAVQLDVIDPDLSDEEFTRRLDEFDLAAIEARARHKKDIADAAALAARVRRRMKSTTCDTPPKAVAASGRNHRKRRIEETTQAAAQRLLLEM